MADPLYPLFSIFSFLGFLLVITPLPWHFQAWNAGTCFYMMWTALSCLNYFINSIMWAQDAVNRAPIWCDISIRIAAAASVGIPASALCIVRRLYKIASLNKAAVSRAEKQRAVLVDTVISVVIPLLLTALQYVTQGHRFNIYEEVGCVVALYLTPVTYVAALMWPILFGLVSAVYCVLSLLAFRRRQLDLQQFMSTNKSLTMSRYLRLMALASVETMCTTPLAIFALVLDSTSTPIRPWISWDDTHFDYGRVILIPSLLWRQQHLVVASLQLTRWAPVICAFIFFGFFGFAEEARRNYANALRAVLKMFGLAHLIDCKISLKPKKLKLPFNYSRPSFVKMPNGGASAGSLPIFISKDVRKDTFEDSPVKNNPFSALWTRSTDFSSQGPPSPQSCTSTTFPSSTTRGDITPTSSDFGMVPLPSAPPPIFGELPPSYSRHQRISCTTTASVVPLDPCPYIVPFDFEQLQSNTDKATPTDNSV